MRYLLQDNPGSPVATQESSCRSRNAQPIPLQSHRQRKTAPKIGSSSVAVYDYRNRVYSANLGRFLQTDPIRFDAGDGNLYRYVKNRVADWVDPMGLMGGPEGGSACSCEDKKNGGKDKNYAQCYYGSFRACVWAESAGPGSVLGGIAGGGVGSGAAVAVGAGAAGSGGLVAGGVAIGVYGVAAFKCATMVCCFK